MKKSPENTCFIKSRSVLVILYNQKSLF